MSNQLQNYSIVFDLDETLIHSLDLQEWEKLPSKLKKSLDTTYKHLVFSIDDETIGIKRPHLDEFLKFVESKFGKVGVWSAGIKPYVENISAKIFKTNGVPYAVWSRFDCDYKMILPEKEVTFVKPLCQMWDKYDGFNEENTFMIEDRKDTVLYNPHNLVRVKAFKPISNPKMLSEDKDLLVLLDFFKEVDKSKEFVPVPRLIKPYLKGIKV
jgi:hypothetical protein